MFMCPWHCVAYIACLVLFCHFTALFFTHDRNQTKIHTDKLPITIIYCYVKCFSLLYQWSAWFMARCALDNGIRHTFHFKFDENSLQMHSIVKCRPFFIGYGVNHRNVTFRKQLKWNEMKWIPSTQLSRNFRLHIRKFYAQMTSMKSNRTYK